MDADLADQIAAVLRAPVLPGYIDFFCSLLYPLKE
jgi:hypothetical protein